MDHSFLQENLAKHNNLPAVFYQEAPDSQDDGWGDTQYPRIDYIVDLQSDYGGRTSGTATISVWSTGNYMDPEDIELKIREDLLDLFICPDNGPPFCLAWRRSDAFTKKDSLRTVKGEQVYGVDIVFEVLDFSGTCTINPDPVVTICDAVKRLDKNITIIGADSIDTFFKVKKDYPAIYIRIESIKKDRENYCVSWMSASIRIHVFAPKTEDKMHWIRCIQDYFCIHSELLMQDDSPMRLSVDSESDADYLQVGQIKLIVEFGILNQQNMRNARRFQDGKQTNR